jgi:hypothetical protein
MRLVETNNDENRLKAGAPGAWQIDELAKYPLVKLQPVKPIWVAKADHSATFFGVWRTGGMDGWCVVRGACEKMGTGTGRVHKASGF